jgi:hypothetical protein
MHAERKYRHDVHGEAKHEKPTCRRRLISKWAMQAAYLLNELITLRMSSLYF